MYGIYKTTFHSDEGDFQNFGKKWYILKRNVTAHFRELPEDEGGISHV